MLLEGDAEEDLQAGAHDLVLAQSLAEPALAVEAVEDPFGRDESDARLAVAVEDVPAVAGRPGALDQGRVFVQEADALLVLGVGRPL